jgi:outer membrane biosynthesis protein TonB
VAPPPPPVAEPEPPVVDRPGPIVERPAPIITPPSAPSEPTTAPAPPSQVAALPPAPEPPAGIDIRSALRGGGAGAVKGGGWGGITGDPIALDSPDPRFQDYLERVRRQIQANMVYPCVKSEAGSECEYKSATLEIHFGILRDGNLQIVELVRSSPWTIYNEYSMNAIKLAQPFPPIPPSIMAALRPGSAGMPIMARFIYSVTVRSILR